MKRPGLPLALAALALLGSALLAADRFSSAQATRERREEAARDLARAMELSNRHPRAFGAQASAESDSALKTLVQESAKNRGVTIGFLSESERDAEKGRRERQVLVRLVNADHRNVVFYLQDLEEHGSGAKVKELHLRPSRDQVDAYEEAELVLSKVIVREGKP
jgi:hypothetical protein